MYNTRCNTRLTHYLNCIFIFVESTICVQYDEYWFCLQVLSVELFRVVKKEFGSNYALILEKVIPVSGDVSLENLGIMDLDLREEIWQNVDIIVNSAATTKFDERYESFINQEL